MRLKQRAPRRLLRRLRGGGGDAAEPEVDESLYSRQLCAFAHQPVPF